MVRRPLLRALLIASVIALPAACSGSSSSKPAAAKTTKTDLVVHVGTVSVASAGPPKELDPGDRDAVVHAVGDYVRAATLDPLDHGGSLPAAQLVAAAAPALTGPQSDALTDATVPRATGSVTATLAPVNLHGLADKNGGIDLVGTTIDLTVHAKTTPGPVTIHRTGELMFDRDGTTWKILGFTLVVNRDGAGIDAATTSTSVKAGT